MEPKLPAPNRGPEHSPVTTGFSVEQALPRITPERSGDKQFEQQESRPAEHASEPMQQVVPSAIQLPQPLPVPLQDDSTATGDDASPLLAADDDLIEREWVDKAKAIIVKTKDDPYQREQEVGKLQAEYLKKRYGKELGAS